MRELLQNYKHSEPWMEPVCFTGGNHACILSRSSHVQLFAASPGKNTGVVSILGGYPFRVSIPDPGIKPVTLTSPALQAGSLPLAPPGKPHETEVQKEISPEKKQ